MQSTVDETLPRLVDSFNFVDFFLHFGINMAVVAFILHFFYYKRSRRRDYYISFLLISCCIFMLIYMLDVVNIPMGFALGLFAIFGIIRYRTEQIPVREMTYLFLIISMSVISALSKHVNVGILLGINAIFILAVTLCEFLLQKTSWSSKVVMYDRIDLITPDKRQELIADLNTRIGINAQRVEVGAVDFLKDMAVLRVYYTPLDGTTNNTVDHITRLPKEEKQ